MKLVLALLLTASGCGAATTELDPAAAASEREAIGAVLDAWHEAAATAHEAEYFGHFTDDAIFLGTDATERWTVPQFRAYAHPFFERGRAWTMRAIRRDIILSASGDLAWFDEDLETARLGPARGSGVLRRVGPGAWKIAHYNLAITIPNEQFDDVRAALTGGDDATPIAP